MPCDIVVDSSKHPTCFGDPILKSRFCNSTKEGRSFILESVEALHSFLQFSPLFLSSVDSKDTFKLSGGNRSFYVTYSCHESCTNNAQDWVVIRSPDSRREILSDRKRLVRVIENTTHLSVVELLVCATTAEALLDGVAWPQLSNWSLRT